MEEGVPSLPPRSMPRPNSPQGDPEADANEHSDSSNLSTAIVPFNKSTYVVRVPKDQIFRVPPPENARIVEEHRNRVKNNPSSRSCCSRVAIISVAILAIALICLCGVIIFYFVANPGVPHINVDSIAVKNPLNTKPEFDIIMKAQNPSKTMDFQYKDGGKVKLFHQGKQIASGDPEDFNIGHKATTEIKLSLQGSKATLPKEITSTAKGSKDIFPLSLSANFPVKLGFGALRMLKKELGVDCDLKISRVGKKMYVKSQNCKASIK